MSAAPRGRRRRSRLALAALMLLAGLPLAEGAVRLRQWVVHGRSGSYYEFVTDPATGLRVPKPGDAGGRGHQIHVNALGFRGAELEVPKPEGRVRLAFLGGSTTFCAEASADAATWPELVAAGLRARHAGRSFDVVNGGAAAFTTVQSLANLEGRIAPLEPDVVFIYHATNDLSHDSRQQALAAGLPGTGRLGESWLAQHSVAWELLEKNLRAARPAADTGGPTLQLDLVALTQGFRANLTCLVQAAQARARSVVLVTFATRQRREQPPDVRRASSTTSLMWMPYMTVDGVLAGFEALNAVIREVAAAEGCVLVDGEHGIPGDAEHFADSVHFTDEGCRAQAERVLEALDAAPQTQWLGAAP